MAGEWWDNKNKPKDKISNDESYLDESYLEDESKTFDSVPSIKASYTIVESFDEIRSLFMQKLVMLFTVRGEKNKESERNMLNQFEKIILPSISAMINK